MKKTIVAVAFILGFIFWHYVNNEKKLAEKGHYLNANPNGNETSKTTTNEKGTEILKKKHVKDLDRLGEVFNEFNSSLSKEELAELKKDRKKYDLKEELKLKTQELEKAYYAKNYSIKDIKRLQTEVADLKRKLNLEVENIEKWDPKFVYYLIINDNYTLSEINQMKNLSEHGLSQDEIEYIKEHTQTSEFTERMTKFKESNELVRKTASAAPKEKDEFIDDPNATTKLEDKLIEMDYNPEEKEEMNYGFNQ